MNLVNKLFYVPALYNLSEIVWNSMLPKPDKKVHIVVVTDPFHLSVHLWVKTFELIPSILEKKSSHLRQNIFTNSQKIVPHLWPYCKSEKSSTLSYICKVVNIHSDAVVGCYADQRVQRKESQCIYSKSFYYAL